MSERLGNIANGPVFLHHFQYCLICLLDGPLVAFLMHTLNSFGIVVIILVDSSHQIAFLEHVVVQAIVGENVGFVWEIFGFGGRVFHFSLCQWTLITVYF